MSRTFETKFMTLALMVIGLCLAFYWGSALSFSPVPWPDDSAFFLPGIEWIKYPPRYRMHAQAAFVSSYDQANFNTMPLMPLLMGIAYQLGIDTSQGIRVFGILAHGAFAFLLLYWLRARRVAWPTSLLIAAGALTDPIIRWGATVVRPEVWQGLLWMLMLMQLDRAPGQQQRRSPWALPILLAIAAYVHFEAIVWVLPCVIALHEADRREWWRALWGTAWRTTLLLSPWLIYGLLNWSLFWEQMGIQFGRLAEHHPYINSAHGLFHSLFMHLGSPAGLPKFFNAGKIVFWGLLIFGVTRSVSAAWREPRRAPLALGAAMAVVTTFGLWIDKPETWFTTMIHMAVWPLVGLHLAERAQGLWPKLGRAAIALLVLLQLATTFSQWTALRDHFSWSRYRTWVECIDRALEDRTRIWQPHWPDVLVELASRRPDRDYTRAVDFQNIEPLLEAHVGRMDAIIHSLYLPPDDRLITGESGGEYEGGPRERDRYYLVDYPWIPFQQYTAYALGRPWTVRVCQVGPFWAALSLRKAPEQ